MSDLEEDAKLVRKLLAAEDGMSDWEVKFAESLGKWVLGKKVPLTFGQRKTADGILKKLDL